jgi:site-specific recombinase XerD
LFRRYILDTLGVSIGRFTFADCTRECVLGFLDYLAARNSRPGTCNQRLAAPKSYLWFAADKDVALQSIALQVRRVPRCNVPSSEKTVIAGDAMAAILEQPPNTRMGLRDRTIMILMYDSGARLGEILSLNLSDAMISGSNPYIRINGKGGKERLVPITLRTAAHLSQYISVYHSGRYPERSLLFFTVVKNTANEMSGSNVERFLSKYARMARSRCLSVPEKVHPHMLRRTRATQLYQSGVSLPLVSRLLGHASLQTTQLLCKTKSADAA